MFHKFDAMFNIAMARIQEKYLEETLQLIAEQLVAALAIERCAIVKIGDDRENYQIVSGVAEAGPPHTLNKNFEVSCCPPILEILETKETLRIDNPLADRRTNCYLLGLIEAIDIKSILFTPVIVKGEVEYILIMDAIRQRISFNEEEVRFVNQVAKIISELRKHEQHVKHRNRLEMVGQMSATFAHEIRNPLMAAGGFIARAKKHVLNDGKDPVLIKYLDIGIKEISRIESTVNNIHEFSKMHQFLNMEEVDVRKFIRGALDASEIVDQKEVKILFRGDYGLPNIFIDKGKMILAINNLLRNAVRHAQSGNGNKLVEIFINKNKTHVKIAIRNPGRLENPEKVFEPFFTTGHDGIGLGLTIAKSIVEAHRGACIKAKNTRGGIVEFTIYLPLPLN